MCPHMELFILCAASFFEATLVFAGCASGIGHCIAAAAFAASGIPVIDAGSQCAAAHAYLFTAAVLMYQDAAGSLVDAVWAYGQHAHTDVSDVEIVNDLFH